MTKSVSIKALVVGVPLLFAGRFGCLQVLNMIPLEPLWVNLSIGALWHCVVMLIGVPLAAGYVAGRVAGHDHELNGGLTGFSFTCYLIVMLVADGGFDLSPSALLGVVPALLASPCAGLWGGLMAAGIKPFARPLSADEASEAAEHRRQEEAEARPGWKLVLLNDERTPMPFVVDVLKRFFGQEHHAAIATMLHAQHHGRAVAAVFEQHEAAQAKLAEVTAFIADAGRPLRCVLRDDVARADAA